MKTKSLSDEIVFANHIIANQEYSKGGFDLIHVSKVKEFIKKHIKRLENYKHKVCDIEEVIYEFKEEAGPKLINKEVKEQ